MQIYKRQLQLVFRERRGRLGIEALGGGINPAAGRNPGEVRGSSQVLKTQEGI